MDFSTDLQSVMLANNVLRGTRPVLKQDPMTALAIGSAIVGGIGNLLGQDSANKTSIGIAQQNREWQTEENQKARDYQTEMWNKQNEYNSPANQRRLLVEGGFNPFVMQPNGSVSGAGSAGVPSMQGAPNSPHIEPINPLGGVSQLMNAVALSNQKEQVDSTVSSNKANIVKTLSQAAITAYDKLGYKGYKDLMDKISPILSSISFEGSRSDIMFNEYLKNNLSARYNQDMDSLNKEIEYNLGKKYGEARIQANLEKLQYDISEIVGRLNTMNVQNEALMKQTAADIVVKAAHAFMLKSEGDKFVADAQTVNQMRQWVTKTAQHEAEIKSVQSYFAGADKESKEGLVGVITSHEGKERLASSAASDLFRKSELFNRVMDRVFNEYIHVGATANPSSNVYNFNPYYQY